jgi:N-methylhydantoinase A/oxoprolinase/acetone carboxylase beta subunit
MGWRLGFDIGGTFTDFVLQNVATGSVIVGKRLTTPHDPAEAVFQGLADLLAAAGTEAGDLEQAVHGTTLGANLIIERKGARTFLVTTRGFRDVLEIQRQLRYNINDLFVDKHPPLIARDQIVEVDERMRADGCVHRPLDPVSLETALDACRAGGAESLAVAFLHSYANPCHEESAAALAATRLPGVPVTLSALLSPQYREYERTNTAVVNAYIMPAFRAYLEALVAGLRARGCRYPLYLMQNSGGIATAEMTARFPVRSLDSGPAAGAILAAHVGALTGHQELIAFDMGGTTAKAALIENGRPARADRLEVDLIGMRQGSGLPINVPSVDLVEIGAGGGSIARIERGLLRVGPDSAGSDPGPACYALGGREPTVTDANLLLGFLDSSYFLGGARRLDPDAARAAVEERVAKPLGLGLVEAAWGIHQLVTLNMEGAIRVVSIGRGKDPRRLACVTFGGAGPVHGSRLARNLGIGRLIIPFAAGVASALGLLIADPRFDLARTLVVSLDEAPWDRINQLFAEMQSEGAAQLRQSGSNGEWRVRRTAEIRYAGQGHELDVSIPPGPLCADSLEAIRQAHAEVYAAHYGYAEPSGTRLEATTWKLEMMALSPTPDVTGRAREQPAGEACKGRRRAYIPEGGGLIECPVYDRYALGHGAIVRGPALVEERETTVVLLPGDRARVDEYRNLLVDIARSEA